MKRISHKDFFTSIGLALLSTLCLSLAAGLWKYLTTLDTVQVVLFIRFLVPYLMLTLWILIWKLKVHVRSIRPYLLRALMALGAQYCLLYVLSKANILTAILFFRQVVFFLLCYSTCF